MGKNRIIFTTALAALAISVNAQAQFPKPTVEGDTTWYVISTPNRLSLHMTSEGTSANIKGRAATFKDNQLWCFIATANGRYNLLNRSNGTYVTDTQSSAEPYYRSTTSAPSTGFSLSLVASHGLYNITDANGNMVNQCDNTQDYNFTQWNYSTDPGNLFDISEVDTSNPELSIAINKANNLLNSTTEGTYPGSFSAETRTAFETAIKNATTAEEVNAAIDAYKKAVNTVQSGKYYYFLSTCSSYCKGKVIYNTSPESGAYLRWGDKTTDENIYWEFIPVADGSTQYQIRNKATGNYLNATSAGSNSGEVRGVTELNASTTTFELTPLYEGESFLVCPTGGNPVHAQENYGVLVTWNSRNYGSASSWKIVEATAEEIAAAEAKTKSDAEEYALTWGEEFDRDGAVDENDWNFGYGFERNNEDQWYQKENAWQEGGNLVIEARKERKDNPWYDASSTDWKKSRQYIDYTSSILTTAGKHDMLYGRLEVRAKIPCVSGSWPAIWLLGYEDVAGEWPSSGEIDVMEYYKDGTLANLVWASDTRWAGIWEARTTPVSGYWQKQDAGWADKFHTWRMDWDKESIKLYLDDELITICHLSRTINRGQWKKVENPFHTPQYLLLNLALGGNNGGTIIDSSFPLQYLVDYVRIYQKDGSAGVEEVGAEDASSIVSVNGDVCNVDLHSFTGEVAVDVYSIAGKQVKSLRKQGGRTATIDVSSLQRGIYILSVADGERRIAEKIAVR